MGQKKAKAAVDSFNFFKHLIESRIITYSLFAALIGYSILRITVSNTTVDAGYFLPIPRDMVELDKLPISDIQSPYTPVGFYFYAIVFKFFKTPSIEYFYFFNLVLAILSTIVFILAIKKAKIFNEAFAGLIFFCAITPLVFDIKLELYVIVFTSIALYFTINFYLSEKKINLLFTGLFIGLATLSKQYSLMLLPAFILILLYYGGTKRIYRNSLSLIAGFSICLSAFFFFHVYWADTPMDRVIMQFTGKSTYLCSNEYGQRNLTSLLSGFRYWTFKMPAFLLLLPILLFTFFKRKDNSLIIFSLLTLLYLLPFYFQVFPHYFYFGFIPLLFVSIKIISSFSEKQNLLLKYAFLIPVMISLYSTFTLFRDWNYLKDAKKMNRAFYARIETEIPPGSIGFVENRKQIYFENRLKSIDLKNFSYGLAVNVNEECLREAIARLEAKPDNFYYIGSKDFLEIQGFQRLKSTKLNAPNDMSHIYIHHFQLFH